MKGERGESPGEEDSESAREEHVKGERGESPGEEDSESAGEEDVKGEGGGITWGGGQ